MTLIYWVYICSTSIHVKIFVSMISTNASRFVSFLLILQAHNMRYLRLLYPHLIFQRAHMRSDLTCKQLGCVPAVDLSSLDVQYSKASHLVFEQHKPRVRPGLLVKTSPASPWLRWPPNSRSRDHAITSRCRSKTSVKQHNWPWNIWQQRGGVNDIWISYNLIHVAM